MSLVIPQYEVKSKKSNSREKVVAELGDTYESIGEESDRISKVKRGPLLTSREKEEYNAQYYVDPLGRAKLSLSRYIYRQTLPLPRLGFGRTQRSLEFCALISSIENLVADEESYLQV